MESLITKESIQFKRISEYFMRVTIVDSDYSFDTFGENLYLTKLIHFGENYIILLYYYTIIVIYHNEKRFIAITFDDSYEWDFYCINDKIITVFHNSEEIQKFKYQIYDLNLKLIASSISNIMEMFSYRNKVFCITNERIVTELSIDENNNLVFNETSADDENIIDSLYVSSGSYNNFKAIKLDLPTYIVAKGRIYIKLCNDRNVYYRNGKLYRTGDYPQIINYMTSDFYYVVNKPPHITYTDPALTTCTKYYINSSDYEIVGSLSSNYHFINKNEYTIPSGLKFSD